MLADKYKKSHVARVLGGALTEIKPLIQDGTVTVGDINSAERAVEREMLMTVTDLKRGLGVLATVGATAPFVGLLGTTMGIVNAFVGMAASDQADSPRSPPVSPKLLSRRRSDSSSQFLRCGCSTSSR
jgi:biopolymer transport protein ExbB/biopolymer transport protein TolQ